jgi:hypothetical protein
VALASSKTAPLGDTKVCMELNDHRVAGLALVPDPDDAPQRRIDHAAVERAAGQLLLALGADIDDPALRETPRRVAAAYAELLTPQPFRASTRQEFLALTGPKEVA